MSACIDSTVGEIETYMYSPVVLVSLITHWNDSGLPSTGSPSAGERFKEA